MKDKVSIIVPIYNAEKYLHDCLKSILNQTYQNIEIILINDGSEDESDAICQYYKLNYPEKIKYFSQKNSGVSAARNLGIENSTGEWIAFVDADDILFESAVEQQISIVNDKDIDWLVSAYTNCLDDFSITEQLFYYDKKEMIGLLLNSPKHKRIYHKIKNIFDDILLMTVWGKLYKSSIVKQNSLAFRTDLSVCEDVVFNFDYLTNTKMTVVSNSKVYYYRPTVGSASSQVTENRIYNLRNLITVMQEYRNLEVNAEYYMDLDAYCCKMLTIWIDKIKGDTNLLMLCKKELSMFLIKRKCYILSFECLSNPFSRSWKQEIRYKIIFYVFLRQFYDHCNNGKYD